MDPGHELTHARFVRHTTLGVNNGHDNNLISDLSSLCRFFQMVAGAPFFLFKDSGQSLDEHFDFLLFAASGSKKLQPLYFRSCKKRKEFRLNWRSDQSSSSCRLIIMTNYKLEQIVGTKKGRK